MPDAKEAQAPAEAATRGAAAPMFQFRKFALMRLLFLELPQVAPEEAKTPDGFEIQLNMNVGIGVSEDANTADVRLAIVVNPAPTVKPYQIEVDVVGHFGSRNATKEQFEKFCQRQAPSILFPYVREIIDRTTKDGHYGEVR